MHDSQDAYRRLAQRLDTTPYRFPATESGAELRLLAVTTFSKLQHATFAGKRPARDGGCVLLRVVASSWSVRYSWIARPFTE